MHPDRVACAGSDATFTGTLVANGRAGVKTLDGSGHCVPVIVLEIESDRGMHMPLHIEQPMPAGSGMDQAEAAARHYRKGQRVTVQTSALSLRLSGVASHVHLHKDDETHSCPASPSSP